MKSVNEPPTAQFGTRSTDWAAVCKDIDRLGRLRPGKWGKVGVYHRSIVTRIRNGEYPSVDPSLYEVTSRGGELYMRRRMKE